MMVDRALTGLAVLALSLLCLGTWPAMLAACSPPHRRPGRHPSHVYLDYSLGYLPVGLAAALSQRSFGAQLTAIFSPSHGGSGSGSADLLALVACGGGALLCLGNLSFQRAVILGVPSSVVLPLQASMTVVFGTTMNFLLQPALSQPLPLFAGVGFFLAAIALSAAAHAAYEAATGGGGGGLSGRGRPAETAEPTQYSAIHASGGLCSQTAGGGDREAAEAEDEAEAAGSSSPLAPHHLPLAAAEGAAAGLPPAEDWAAGSPPSSPQGPIAGRSSVGRGLAVAALGGVCFGFFSPAFNVAVNDPGGWCSGDRSGSSGGYRGSSSVSGGGSGSSEHCPLTVWTANFFFTLSFALASVVTNVVLMRRGAGAGAGEGQSGHPGGDKKSSSSPTRNPRGDDGSCSDGDGRGDGSDRGGVGGGGAGGGVSSLGAYCAGWALAVSRAWPQALGRGQPKSTSPRSCGWGHRGCGGLSSRGRGDRSSGDCGGDDDKSSSSSNSSSNSGDGDRQSHSLVDHALALGAGIVCGLGNGAQFLGGKLAGFAAADLVQVSTRVKGAARTPS